MVGEFGGQRMGLWSRTDWSSSEGCENPHLTDPWNGRTVLEGSASLLVQGLFGGLCRWLVRVASGSLDTP